MNPVRFGIVGTGSASHRYYGKACRELPEAEIVAAYDARPERTAEFADAYGCDAESSLEALLARADVEAVFVTTQAWHHCEPTVAACRAGKHVLCEKPMATSMADANRMVEAARDAGVILGGIFQLRADNHFSFLRDKIRNGELGAIHTVEITSRWGFDPTTRERRPDLPGILINMMIHSIDFARGLCGEVAEIEFARVEYRHPDWDPPYEDLVAAVWRFESGARCVLSGCCSGACSDALRKREMVIVGDRGCALLDSMSIRELSIRDPSGTLQPVAIPPANRPGHPAQIRDFAHAVREGRRPMIGGEDHRASLRVMLEILEKGGGRTRN